MTAAEPIPVIINPAAKGAGAARKLSRVRGLSPRVQLRETTGAGDARRIARELAAEGVPLVVAAGGDGTVNEVMAGLAETPPGQPAPALGVLPLGTMNVFALEMRLPVLNLAACWERIENGRPRPVDLWQAGGRVFAQMAGVGLDASVVRETSWQSKKRWGPFSYIGTLIRLLDQPPAQITVEIDSGECFDATAILIGNGRFYGGLFPVFPGAQNDDGWLDLAIIRGHGPALMGGLFIDILQRAEREETVVRRRARQCRITSASEAPFEVDGELAGATPLAITPAARNISVMS